MLGRQKFAMGSQAKKKKKKLGNYYNIYDFIVLRSNVRK